MSPTDVTSAHEMTRAQLIATFTLYGFEPATKMSKRGPCVSIAVLWRREDRRVIYIGKTGEAILNKPAVYLGHLMVDDGGHRLPRPWCALTLPKMRLMYARLMLFNAKQARQAAEATV